MSEQTAVQEFRDGTSLKESPLVTGLSSDFGVTATQFLAAIRATVMPAETPPPIVLVFLAVAKEYGLNPLTKEIAAFAKSGKIVPMVMVDGWLKIANRHPQMDGLETEEIAGADGKVAAVKATVYRKDRNHPVTATEYLTECKRNTEPWNQMPVRMLTNKAIIQAIRRAFSISGIYDQDEAADIAATPDDRAGTATARGIDALKDKLAAKNESAALQAQAVDAEEAESGAPPEDGAERTDGAERKEPEGGGEAAGLPVSGSTIASPEPEAPKRGRPVGSRNKPKEGGAESPPVPAASPVVAGPAPLPPPPADDAPPEMCYFCPKPATGGDKYALPDGRGTIVNRCPICKTSMDAVLREKGAGLPATAPEDGLPCSATGCPVRGATVKCVDCGYVFCKEHLKLLPTGDAVCQECDGPA
jgi:phage recombination protein Bet